MYLLLERHLLSAGLSLYLAGCINASTLQTGRTMGEDNVQLLVAGGYGYRPVVANDTVRLSPHSPHLMVDLRTGVSANTDFAMRLDLLGPFDFSMKHQIIGDQHSLFAMSVGVGFGFISPEVIVDAIYRGMTGKHYDLGVGERSEFETPTLLDVSVPVYASLHFSEMFAAYASAKYMFYRMEYEDETSTTMLNLAGGTAGVRWGKGTGVMVEFSYMTDVTGVDYSVGQLSAGWFVASH